MNDLVTMNENTDDEYMFSRYRKLSPYLMILAESFPNAVTQTEIANRTSVTKAAISKHSKLIKKLCNKDTFLSESKLKLKLDIYVVQLLFSVFLFNIEFDKLGKLLESKYFKSYLKKDDLLANLLDSIEINRGYFGEDDIFFLLDKLSKNIEESYDKENINKTLIPFPRSPKGNEAQMFSIGLSNYLFEIGNNIGLCIEKEEDIETYVNITNRMFDFLLNIIKNDIIPKMEIFNNLEEDEKILFQNVYMKTFEYYLGKFKNDFIKKVKNSENALS